MRDHMMGWLGAVDRVNELHPTAPKVVKLVPAKRSLAQQKNDAEIDRMANILQMQKSLDSTWTPWTSHWRSCNRLKAGEYEVMTYRGKIERPKLDMCSEIMDHFGHHTDCIAFRRIQETSSPTPSVEEPEFDVSNLSGFDPDELELVNGAVYIVKFAFSPKFSKYENGLWTGGYNKVSMARKCQLGDNNHATARPQVLAQVILPAHDNLCVEDVTRDHLTTLHKKDVLISGRVYLVKTEKGQFFSRYQDGMWMGRFYEIHRAAVSTKPAGNQTCTVIRLEMQSDYS